MNPDTLTQELEGIRSHPNWAAADEARRREMAREIAKVSAMDDDPEYHDALTSALWQEVNPDGLGTRAAKWVGGAVKEVALSIPATGVAAGMAATDAVGATDTGSGTRLTRGVADLWDAAGQRIKQLAPGDNQEELAAALDDLQADFRAGTVPPGVRDWLAGSEPEDEESRTFVDLMGRGLARLAVKADHSDATPEQEAAYLASDRSLLNPQSEAREFLADFLVTRDPGSWSGFVERVTETDAQHTTRLARSQAEQGTREWLSQQPGWMQSMGERGMDMQASPIDLASAALPLLRGVKLLKAVKAGKRSAVGGLAVDALKEGAQEGATAYLEDARNTGLEIAEAAAMGAVGGAGVQAPFALAGKVMRGPDQAQVGSIEGDMPGVAPAAPTATATQIEVDGQTWQYDPNRITPDALRAAAPETVAALQQAGIIQAAPVSPPSAPVAAAPNVATAPGQPATPLAPQASAPVAPPSAASAAVPAVTPTPAQPATPPSTQNAPQALPPVRASMPPINERQGRPSGPDYLIAESTGQSIFGDHERGGRPLAQDQNRNPRNWAPGFKRSDSGGSGSGSQRANDGAENAQLIPLEERSPGSGGALPTLRPAELEAAIGGLTQAQGQERDVYFDKANNVVIKLTKPGEFGVGNAGVEGYMQRLAEANEAFDAGVQVVGVVQFPGEAASRVVTVEPLRVADKTRPEPKQREIDIYMRARNFLRTGLDGVYLHQSKDQSAHDALPKNFVRTSKGRIYAVDVILREPSSDQHERYTRQAYNQTQVPVSVLPQLETIRQGVPDDKAKAAVRLLDPGITAGSRFVRSRSELNEADFSPDSWVQLEHAEGFFDPVTGQSTVLLDNVRPRENESPGRAVARVLLHERLGHEGLSALRQNSPAFAKKWADLVRQAMADPAIMAQLRAIAADPAYAGLGGDPNLLVEEWFARQAEQLTEAELAALKPSSVLAKLWQALRDVLGRVFVNFARKTSTQTEVREILALSRQALERGDSAATRPGQPLRLSAPTRRSLDEAERYELERWALRPLPPPAILPNAQLPRGNDAGDVARLGSSLAGDGIRIPGLRVAGQSSGVAWSAGELELAKQCAALFGRRIVVVESNTPRPPFNGVINSGIPDVIFIHARNNRPVWSLMGHELWHHMENAHPDLAGPLRQVLEQEMINKDKLAQQKAQYAVKLHPSELMGDFLGDSLGRPGFWDRLESRNPGLFMKLATVVKTWLKQVRDALAGRGFGSHVFVRDVSRVESMLAEALAEFAAREGGASSRPLGPAPLPSGPVNQFSTDGMHPSQFGERVQVDPRLTPEMRAAPVTEHPIQRQQDIHNQARDVIRQQGLAASLATFRDNTTLPIPLRIAGLMQIAQNFDAQSAAARATGDPARVAEADQLVEAAVEAKVALETIGNEAGRNLAMFNTWARLSPDGMLARLERKLAQANQQNPQIPATIPAAIRPKLQQMATQAMALPEGVLRTSAMADLMAEFSMIEGIKTGDLWWSVWYGNVLSGLATQSVNMAGSTENVLLSVVELGTLQPRSLAAYLRGLVRGMKQGSVEAWSVLKGGPLIKPGKWTPPGLSGVELMMRQGGPQTNFSSVREGARSVNQWAAYLASAFGTSRFVGRLLGGMDAVFYYTLHEGAAAVAIQRALRKAGIKPGTPQFRQEVIRQMGGDPAQYQADLQQARAELQAAGRPVTKRDVMRRAWELVRERREQGATAEAEGWAARGVYQNELRGSGKWVSGLITQMQRLPLAGRLVVPFNQILSALFSRGLDYTGVGLARGLLGYHLMDLAAPPRTGRVRMTSMERRQRAVAGVVGPVVTVAIAAYASQFKEQDDEDIPFWIYDSGPKDKTRRRQMPKGWRPYTIKVGGRYVRYSETPLGPMLAAVAGWLNSERYTQPDTIARRTNEQKLSIALQAALLQYQDLGVLSGIAELMDIITGDERPDKAFQDKGARSLSGVVPLSGLMREIETLFDPTKIHADTLLESLQRDIPVVSGWGTKPDLNAFAEPLTEPVLPVVKRFMTQQKDDPNWSWVRRNGLKIPAVDLNEQLEIGRYLMPNEADGTALKDIYAARGWALAAADNGLLTRDQRYHFAKRTGELMKERVEAMRRTMEAGPTGGVVPADARIQVGGQSVLVRDHLQSQVERMFSASKKAAMHEVIQMAATP